MSFIAETLESPSGAQLRLHTAAPEGAPRAIIQIHHGMSEHSARYARFATFLVQRGYAVGAHDHRGHGETTYEGSKLGLFAPSDGWAKVMQDALAVEDTLRGRHPGVPLIVFGHSMGGVIAMNQAMDRKGALDGLAVWNANLALGSRAGLIGMVLTLENLFKKSTDYSTWLDALTFKSWGKNVKGSQSQSDWLSHIREEVDAYLNDPLCGGPGTISLWRDFMGGVELGSDETRLNPIRRDLPIHMAAGGEDPATEGGKAMKVLAARLYNARFSDATMRFDPKARHETLNEIGYDQAMADFADWADRVTAA